MALTYKEVAEILKIIDASACEEVVLDLPGVRLEVRRSQGGSSTGPARLAPAQPAAAAPPRAQAPTEAKAPAASPMASGKAARQPPAAGVIEVRAPMVGTFYRRPSPDSPPFVEVGQRVKAGDPIGLIEVMKLFTTIPSPANGVIEAIAFDNSGPVEFDQVIMTLKKG